MDDTGLRRLFTRAGHFMDMDTSPIFEINLTVFLPLT